MSIEQIVKDSLTLVIPSGLTRDMNSDDIQRMLLTYQIMEVARDNLLSGKLTPDEYFQLAESAEINVDSYMQNIEHNLIVLGAA